jgi:DNA end-binding protein Ku
MRSIWTGSLSFGLVNIPVKLYSAAMERSLSFKLFDKHGNCPVSYMKVCRASGKEVKQSDIVKGYEYEKGDFVILDEKDFEKAKPVKTDLIDIVQFTDEADVDVKYFEKPYYIEPDKKAGKAYALLRDALKESGKVAVSKFIMRQKEYVAVIRPENDVLILDQLRYEDEIRDPTGLDIPKKGSYKKAELDMALSLIRQLTKKYDAKKFKDTYTEELEKVIKAKAKGKRVKVDKDEKAPENTDMKDLMKALQMSLESKTSSKKKVPAHA